jgi:hypothetical protein
MRRARRRLNEHAFRLKGSRAEISELFAHFPQSQTS